jgi:ABC-type sulfate/molybdate transport systems ATPase subunit
VTPRYRLEHVVRRYRPVGSGRTIEALRVAGLEVAPGEILAVVGPNGSGKSTLLETMAFLGRPDEGRVLLDGHDAWHEGTTLAARRRCPMLLQRTVLFKTTVLGNVMYGMRARGIRRPQARNKAEHVLRLVGLDGLARRMHRELSGGERRRVALARLLALEPEILLLDEPTAHVDHDNARLIEGVIRDLHATSGMTVILASHDLRQAQALADRVVTLVDGQLFSGTIDNLFAGRLEAEGDRFTFHAEADLRLDLPAEAFAAENGPSGGPSPDASVRIAIDAERLELLPEHEAAACPLVGRIESVDQHQDRCRLMIRLKTGQRLCAIVSESDYALLGLNLGRTVGLRFAEQSVRVIRSRS